MKLLNICILTIYIIVLNSCEEKYDLPQIEKKLVVDGWIEKGGFANVILTYNTGYFDNLDSASFRDLVDRFAKVTVYCEKDSEILTLTRDTDYFPPFIYRGNMLKGKAGKNYILKVEDEIGIYYAQTNIPFPVIADSLWVENQSDSTFYIKGRFNDDPNANNFYRTFTKLHLRYGRFIPTLISTYDDKYFNGQEFTFSLKKGNESYLKPVNQIYFTRGDTIIVKISTIDEASYDFWRSYNEEVLNSGNPFAANHSKIISNISGGLGIWCGYGSTNYILISKRKGL